MRRRIRDSARHDLPVPIDVHIGVAMGLGIAGDISGPLIREFAVMGDHVDRADALTHAAESGEIHVDDATHRAVREVFEFGAAEPGVLPGAAAAQPTWDLLSTCLGSTAGGSARSARSSRSWWGGRKSSKTGRGDRCSPGRGRGEAWSRSGARKSRLLAELRKRDDKALWLEGRSISTGRNLSYSPDRRSAPHRGRDRRRRRRGVAREGRRAVPSWLPDRAAETAPCWPILVGVALAAERERLARIQGDALEKLVRSAILQLLRAASAGRPVVVLMEDLHWADLSSVELVESLLRLAEESPSFFLNAPTGLKTSGRVLAFARSFPALRRSSSSRSAGRRPRHREEPLPRRRRAQKTCAAIEERARGNPSHR
jgi:hypothetical protein